MVKNFFKRLFKNLIDIFSMAGKQATENEQQLLDKNGRPFEIKNQKRFM